MRESFKFDLMDKKVQKQITVKGLLDVNWDIRERVLSISYDPIEEALKIVLDAANATPELISTQAISNKRSESVR